MINIQSALRRWVSVEVEEIKALLVSCLYFFMILCAYYVIRPVRNEMVIANGVENIHWLATMAFVTLILITPIFGWVTTRFRTRQFLSYCTVFFASHLIIFFVLFNVEERSLTVTRAFYVWVNVFNMFIVSLFWSFMNDIYSRSQSKRLFAFIAAGGTAGAISGPIITTMLVEKIGLGYLLLIPAGILCASVICITWLIRWDNLAFSNEKASNENRKQALKGGALDAFTLIAKSPYLIGITLFMLLYATSIVFVEIQQAEIVARTYDDPVGRTKLFSIVDFSSNALALVFQLFITSKLIKRFGFKPTFLILPIGVTIGFGLIAGLPILMGMVGVEIFRRSADYAFSKPTREMLFSVLSREEKYKAKNFIDTAVLRGGSMTGTFAFSGVRSLSTATAPIAGISLVLGLSWCATAFWLGKQFDKKQEEAKHLNNSSMSE